MITIKSLIIKVFTSCFYCLRFKDEFTPIHLNKLQFFIDSKRIDPNQKIDMKVLRDSGAIGSNIKDGVRLLGSVSNIGFYSLCLIVK